MLCRCTKVCSLIHLSHTVIRISKPTWGKKFLSELCGEPTSGRYAHFSHWALSPCRKFLFRTPPMFLISVLSLFQFSCFEILSCPKLLCNRFSHSWLLPFHVWLPFANHRATPHYRQLPRLRVKVSAEKASTPATVGNAKIC